MRVFVAAMLLSVPYAAGQGVVDISKIPSEWRDFQPRPEEKKLECRVTPIPPRLNYSFRFQTGYILRLPLRQFEGKRRRIATLFRVTPENSEREPVYLLSNAVLPAAPEGVVGNVSVESGGGYVVGEGKYRVDLVLTDDAGRVCTDNWNINAKLDRKIREVEPGMPPGTVDEISLRKWTRGSKGAKDTQGHRLTVLMNAAPVLAQRVRLGGYDRVLLLSSLASLVERLPLRSVRLIVFNLDQQREIYRDDDFAPADFGKVAQSLSELELGTVDYDVLKNPRGHVDMVADLVNESLKHDDTDAVIFVGPKPRYLDKVERSALPPRGPEAPSFFYVQFRPFVFGASFPDTLMNAVRQIGGKTFEVYTPKDFAEAIAAITKALEGSTRGDAAH